MKELIKQILKEELGVPSNITNVANQIYNEVVGNLDDSDTVESLENRFSYIRDKFKIGDLKFKRVEYHFDFKINDVDNEIAIAGMATQGGFKVTKKFKIKSTIDNDTFHIKFVMVVPSDATGKDIKDYIKSERTEFISSITHELKHKYDDYKKPKTSLTQRGEYIAYTNNGFGDITPINKFIHHLYFTHTIENLVRPSELAGAIYADNITKKDFYNFITNNRVFKELKELSTFTYEGFRQDLMDYVDKIKVLFQINNIDYDGLTDDEIVDKTLSLLLLNLRQWKAESTHRLLMNNPIEILLGFDGKKGEFFDKYLKKLSKYEGDFKKYFENESKMFNFVGVKMIKKLSKLYAMTKNDTNESIINWELWQKINGNNQKIVTEFSFLKESDGRLPKSHPMVKAISDVVGEVGEYEDWYSTPFADNEEATDFFIRYKLDKVSIWKENDNDFSGTIKLIISDILIGNSDEDQWERMYYRDDLPSWTWDRLEESIIEKIEKWIPNVGVDIELKFPGPKN